MENKITLYTVGCPRCRVLETKLADAGINYESCDDIDMMEAKGFKSAPMLEVNGTIYTFSDAIKWIKQNQVRGE